MKLSKLTYNPKMTSILILGICLIGMLIGNYVQRFRISDYRWIYQYGSYLNLIMVLGSVGWSFFHPLIIWSERKPEWKSEWRKKPIWILIGLIPFLYFGIGMIITMFKTVE